MLYRPISRSSRPLHTYQTICRPGSGPAVIHLPHLSLIDTVRLRLDRGLTSSCAKLGIDGANIDESFVEDGVVIYPIRWVAISLNFHCESVGEHRISLTVFGFDLSQTPESSQLIDLLNLSVWFRERQLWSNVLYSDLLSGLALIQSRSYLQASELLYSTSLLLEKIDPTQQNNVIDMSTETQSDIPLLCTRESLLLLSAAALYPTMKSDKLLRILGELAGYSNFSLSDLHKASRIQPLVEIVTGLLLHEMLAVRQAASRTLEFLLESIGCDGVGMLDQVVTTLILIQDDMDLVEPILQAILSNLYLMTADALHDLVLDVIGPGLHQALTYPLSDSSVGVCLRLLLGALLQLKSGVQLSADIIDDLFNCYHERYQDSEWILNQIWGHIGTYDPVCLHQIPIVDVVISVLGRASTAPAGGVQRILRLIITMHGAMLDRALNGSDLFNYGIALPDLISALAQALINELNRGDQFAVDQFRSYWQALVLTITLYRHCLESDDHYGTIRLDQLADSIIQAALHMISQASPKLALVQVMQVIVPDLEPSSELIVLLKKIMFWVPETVNDEIFDLIHILVSKLRHRITWEHLHDIVWILCHKSTTRSISANRCRHLIQDIIMQNGYFSTLLATLERTTDSTRSHHVIEFLTEAIDYIGSSALDLVPVITSVQPIIINDLHGCRYSSLSMLKKLLISNDHIQFDTVVIETILASGQAVVDEGDPGSQLLITELLGILFRRRSWPSSYTTRSWSYLQLCDQTTNWDNVRRMAQWAGLIIAMSHFSEIRLADSTAKAWSDSALIWHESICRACESASCWKTRLWGLKLIWIVSFRSGEILRCAPDFIITRLRLLHQLDPDPDIRLAADAMIGLIDQIPGATPSACESRLNLGSPPSTLSETTITIPDLRHRPARSTSSSPAPGLDDTCSDVSEGVLGPDDHDAYIMGGEHDERIDLETDMIPDEIQTNTADDQDDNQGDWQSINKSKESGEDNPRRSLDGEKLQPDLSDLSSIELQFIHD